MNNEPVINTATSVPDTTPAPGTTRAVATPLRAIPAKYAGITFRSRAEARWAMVFDLLDIEYRYENEGYQLATCWYLPDFWLPRFAAFAEVKSAISQWDVNCEIKASDLVKATQHPLLICDAFEADAFLVVDCLVPDSTVPWGYEGYHCNLRESAERGRLWLDQDIPGCWFAADKALRSRIDAIKSHRFYAPR